ncbi:MAG: DUF4399 domain-containing protein [Alcanivorax sp.]|nr:DUF4399 domain-containing protein [Alcanivorax sp.]
MRTPLQRSALIALLAGAALLQGCSDDSGKKADMHNAATGQDGMANMGSEQATPAMADTSAQADADNGITRTPSPADAKVFIVSPGDGDTVSSPVKVVFGIEGMSLAPAGTDKPNTGHHHLLVDLDQLPDMNMPLPANDHVIHFGKAQTETTLDLAPGQHTLQLLLADYRHVPFEPPVISQKITITVK